MLYPAHNDCCFAISKNKIFIQKAYAELGRHFE
jgi:hypothetical protein